MLGAADATQRTAVLDFMRARDTRSAWVIRCTPCRRSSPTAVRVDVADRRGVRRHQRRRPARHQRGRLERRRNVGFRSAGTAARQKSLMDNASTTTRSYGLDGDVRILRYDINQDGIITSAAGDRVYLYVGMRRGGRHYYALDVTDRNSPRLLFKLGPTQLAECRRNLVAAHDYARQRRRRGAERPAPRADLRRRIRPGQESTPMSNDDEGNRIYMVDAKTGALLWYAGKTDRDDAARPTSSAQFHDEFDPVQDHRARLERRCASRIACMRRTWAVASSASTSPMETSRSTLVTGGVIAALGQGLAAGGMVAISEHRSTRAASTAVPTLRSSRSRGATPYISISLGSGYRGHPLNHANSGSLLLAARQGSEPASTRMRSTRTARSGDHRRQHRTWYDITSNPSRRHHSWRRRSAGSTHSRRAWVKRCSPRRRRAAAWCCSPRISRTAPDAAEPCRSRHRQSRLCDQRRQRPSGARLQQQQHHHECRLVRAGRRTTASSAV